MAFFHFFKKDIKFIKKPLAENMEKVYNDMVRKRFRKNCVN